MSYTETITCRVAIQICIGYFPDGRERHRTFSMKGIRADAPDEAIAAIVRALAPTLAYPITKVRKVIKRTIIFDDWSTPGSTNGCGLRHDCSSPRHHPQRSQTRHRTPCASFDPHSARCQPLP